MSYFKSIFHQFAKRTAPDAVTLKWLAMILDKASETVMDANSALYIQHQFLLQVLRSPFDLEFTPNVLALVLKHGSLGKVLVTDDELELDDQVFANYIQSRMHDIQYKFMHNPGYMQRAWKDRERCRSARRRLTKGLRRALREFVEKSRMPPKQKKEIRNCWERHQEWTNERLISVGAGKNYLKGDIDVFEYMMDHDGSFTDAVARVDHLLYFMERATDYKTRVPKWSPGHALPVDVKD